MPKDPSNATLGYWQDQNITASEIDWLGLDVKVSIITFDECSNVYPGVLMRTDNIHNVHSTLHILV